MSSKTKFDKTTVIVVGVCIILLFGWTYIFGPTGLNWLPKQEPQKQEQVEKTADNVSRKTPSKENSVVKSAADKTAQVAASAKKAVDNTVSAVSDWESKFSDIEATSPDSLYSMKINPAKGAIDSVTLNKISTSNKSSNVILAKDLKQPALSISQPNDEWTLVNVRKPVKTDDSIINVRQFKNQKGQEFTLIQKWVLGKNYSTNYTVTVINNSSSILNMRELYIYTGAIPPVEYVSGDVLRMESHSIDALLAGNNSLYTVKAGSSDFLNQPIQYEPINWVSASDGYYAYILKAAGKNGTINGGNYIYTINESVVNKKGDKQEYSEIGAAAREQAISIKPNQRQQWNFAFYAGPKDITLLKAFAPKADDTLHLMSWPVMRSIAKWFLFALIWLKGVCGSFGLAIILLTIVVKLVFWPLTHKSNMSMKRMQKIQPMVKELREQYKDDKQKLNQATMQLYKEQKVNPLGGCLPMLIQIPVLIALYYTLMGAFEIRHASFLWAADLTQPDTVAHIMGLPINPFAILMAITMLAQQKMTPTATDPAQAKMMMLMPLIMLVFLYNLPSGLTLYWTVSQVITIIQLLYNKYFSKDEDDKKTSAKAKKKKA